MTRALTDNEREFYLTLTDDNLITEVSGLYGPFHYDLFEHIAFIIQMPGLKTIESLMKIELNDALQYCRISMIDFLLSTPYRNPEGNLLLLDIHHTDDIIFKELGKNANYHPLETVKHLIFHHNLTFNPIMETYIKKFPAYQKMLEKRDLNEKLEITLIENDIPVVKKQKI